MSDLPLSPPEVLRAIYEPTLRDINHPARPRIFLSGGRGMGKTFLLQELAERASAPRRGAKVSIVHGRDWESASAELDRRRVDRAAGRPSGALDLLLDDLDRLIVAVGAQGPGMFEALMGNLSDLISGLPTDGRRCVFTSRFSASRMVEMLAALESRQERDRRIGAVISAFSTLIQMYDNVPINPWPADWRARTAIHVHAFVAGLTSSQQDLCSELLIKLTGGHPALLVPALVQLSALAGTGEAEPGDGDTGVKTRSLASASRSDLKLIIEDAAHSGGIGTLRRAINGLRESERDEWRGAYEDVLRFAQHGSAMPSRRSREILAGEGLMFREDEPKLQYVIPGEILRGELLGEPVGPLQMEIEPDTQAPEAHGSLRIRDHFRELRVPLSGGSWSVLKIIFEEPARFVSLEDLRKRTHLRTDSAVRSAIQRLIADARAAGVENILDNLYGKGYRKGESPSWT